MTLALLPGEREMLAGVVADLSDDAPKLVYADWLEERGGRRADFLRAFVKAARTMSPSDFPPARKGLPEEWLELIGYRLLKQIADAGLPELKRPVLRLARPALRLKKGAAGRKVPVGASKVGGLPDLPPGFRWPPGGDCHAIYNDDTGGTDRLAGFLAQINFAEIAHTQAARELPEEGLLSFFCFQDIENDNPDAIGAKAVFFPSPAGLVRTRPPKKLTEGNGVMPPRRLTFAETLDLPEPFMGPWSKEVTPGPNLEADYRAVYDHFRELNFHNLLGYARATSGGDPTPSKESRHLIVLENAAGCQLHIQLSQKDLAARNFEAITLNWVDFD